jgi:hypothetical protein
MNEETKQKRENSLAAVVFLEAEVRAEVFAARDDRLELDWSPFRSPFQI